MTEEDIKKIIEKAIHKKYRNFNGRENHGTIIFVEKPKDSTHGDYFTNIAFELAKILKKNPNEIALTLKNEIAKSPVFKNVEIVGGFINFFINDKFFYENIKKIQKEKGKFGTNQLLKNKKVIVEYTDANILKEFHIGHLMSNAIGESLSRMLEFQGAKVKRANYQGDVGMHVAKAIWGKLKHPNQSWQYAYVAGSGAYDEDEILKQEIVELNKKIYDKSDKKLTALCQKGKKESLKEFEKIYKKLGTKFDYYFFESEVWELGKKLVENGLQKGIFEKGEKGAIIFKGEKFGLHTRVFINSEGLPTYEAKELALAKEKYKKYAYDLSVVITGNEINEYFKVLMVAMGEIFPDLAKKPKHIGHGMMRLPEGKTSSRTGRVVTAESLFSAIEALALEKIKDRDLYKKEKHHIKEAVAVAAVKYSILKQSIGSDIVYDIEKSVSFQGDAGPYLQYSLARAISVSSKAKKENVKASLKKVPDHVDDLVKHLYYFPEIVKKAGEEFEPHYLTLYLTELSSLFNNYYARHKIVDKDDVFSPYKVALTEAFSNVMVNGLWLLGINHLVRM